MPEKAVESAFRELKIAFAEALHIATTLEKLSINDSKKYLAYLDTVEAQIQDLRFFIKRRGNISD